MVRLPPAVKELAFRNTPLVPVSSLKFPRAVVGARPAIKLSVAGVHVGVNGHVLAVPNWLAVVTVTCAEAEPASDSSAAAARLAGIFQGCFFKGDFRFMLISEIAGCFKLTSSMTGLHNSGTIRPSWFKTYGR